MSKCPYCQSDMETGFIEADQRGGVVWYKGTEKRTLLDYTPLEYPPSDDTVVLDKRHLFKHCFVKSEHCKNCNKMIIDLDYNKQEE